jgi:outer membrane receptor protein involved in Fe transport
LTSGPAFARVVVDGAFPGELNELRQISTESIETLTFLSPSDATTKYGTGYLGGVIEVRTRTGPR